MSTGETGQAPPETDVVAVVGVCAPERGEYARRLAASRGLMLVPAKQLAGEADALSSALWFAAQIPGPPGVLLEYPMETPAREIVGELTDKENSTALRELVCIVDAAHLIADLAAADHVAIARGRHDEPPVMAPRAELIATQIEFASTVVLTNCARLDAGEQSLLRALVSHLSPEARVELTSSTRTAHYPGRGSPFAAAPYTREQTRPGWISLLNGEFAPSHRHPRISALRYLQPRPFHPLRLHRFLEDSASDHPRGVLLRSVGFCRLCSRPYVTAHWDQAGTTVSLTPAALDQRLTAEDEPLAFGQDLALIGLDLDMGLLAEALDDAVLTDSELLAGPQVWETFPDPFPMWHGAGR